MDTRGAHGASFAFRRWITNVTGAVIAGCLLYGLVLLRHIALHMGPCVTVTSPETFVPGIRDILQSQESDDSLDSHSAPTKASSRKMAAPTVTSQQAAFIEAQKAGMHEVSDSLPGQPDWDASEWTFEEKVDPESNEWPNTLAICAIMKGEHPHDIVEWLKYHQWLGVDKVFLRENDEQLPEGLMPRVQGMVDSGFLDIGAMPGPKHPLQNQWYNRCSKPDMAGEHSWVTFLDLDEFMVVLDDGVASKNPDLKGLLESFKGNAGLSMQWVLFGSSGHEKRPTPGGPLDYYHQCTGYLSYQMKCMANMYHATHHMMVLKTAVTLKNVHDCTYKLEDGMGVQNPPVTTTDGAPLDMFENTELTNPKNDTALGRSRSYLGHLDEETYDRALTNKHRLVLFHYVTRSLEDYTGRKLNRHSGIYAYRYVEQYGHGKKRHMDLMNGTVMADFEHANDFDGTAPVCSSAKEARYVDKCCRAKVA